MVAVMKKLFTWIRIHYAIAASIAVSASLISILFTNCGQAVLGDLSQNANNISGNGAQSVNVGAGTCPANQIAIGLGPNQNAICAPITTTTQASCPANSSLELVGSGSLQCVVNTSWDQTGTLCPVGEYLSSYSTSGAIQCAWPSAPNGGPTYSCPSGQYISGIANGQAVCSYLPVNVPTAQICPTGKYLYDLTGSGPDCRVTPWTQPTSASCPSGTFAIGWLNGQIQCQQNIFTSAIAATIVCPNGKILLSYSDASGPVCVQAPDPDLSYACPSSYNVSGIQNSEIVCQSAGPNGGPQCPAGQLVIGLSGGLALCALAQENHLPGSCPNSSYPIGTSNGSLVCALYGNVQMPMSNTVCVPQSTNLCSVNGGIGTQTCNSNGMAYSSCTAIFCGSGFNLSAGSCTPTTCFPGASQSCPINNGSGNQFCGTQGNWGQCQIQTCNAGFVAENGSCMPIVCSPSSTTSCSSGPAYGFKTCQTDGTSYGACYFTSCQNGYTLENQVCVDTTPPRVSFSVVPANPTIGNSASLAFAAIDNESGVQSVTCMLDSSAYTPCTSPEQLMGLSNGNHTFKVTATDVAGNSASQSTSWANQVCASGSTQQCSISNGAGAATCQANGTYGTCMAVSCSTGYQLVAGSCQALNCQPGFSISGNQCVDNTPPAVNVSSAPANPTVGTTAAVQFTATDSGSGIASLTCQLDMTAPAACQSPLNLSPVPFGNHTLTIVAKDVSGNSAQQIVSWTEDICSPGSQASCGITNGTGQETCMADGSGYGACMPTSCSVGFTASGNQCLDKTAPVLTITQAPSNPTAGTSASAQFTATDSGSGLASVTCKLDSAAAAACTSPINYSGLSSGTHTLVITATDKSGNATSSTLTWQNQIRTTGTNVYYYIGGSQSFTVPVLVTSVTVKAWGAGGGAGGYDSYLPGLGGGGSYSSAALSVTPGQALTIVVGGGGGGGASCTAGNGGGGGGGEYSAGGAGAGGAAGSSGSSVNGGGAGQSMSLDGGGAGGGGGGVSGGAGGTVAGGNGGSSPIPQGRGGVGAGYCDCGGTGGGGGTSNASSIAGSGTTQGNAGDAQNGGAGAGGASTSASGASGLVIISW